MGERGKSNFLVGKSQNNGGGTQKNSKTFGELKKKKPDPVRATRGKSKSEVHDVLFLLRRRRCATQAAHLPTGKPPPSSPPSLAPPPVAAFAILPPGSSSSLSPAPLSFLQAGLTCASSSIFKHDGPERGANRRIQVSWTLLFRVAANVHLQSSFLCRCHFSAPCSFLVED